MIVKVRWTQICWLFAAMVSVTPAAAALPQPSAFAAAADDSQSQCPPSTASSPGFRTYLPDCRAYELVSPSFEDGFIADFSPTYTKVMRTGDGSSMIVGSFGGFAGDQSGNAEFGKMYRLTRSEGEWAADALTPIARDYPYSGFLDAGANLDKTLWETLTRTQYEAKEEASELYLREADGHLGLIGPETAGKRERLVGSGNYRGASADLSRIVYRIVGVGALERARGNGGEDHLWQGDTTMRGPSLYEYQGTSQAEPRLVGVSNPQQLKGTSYVNEGAKLISQCGTELGSEGDKYNAISSAGNVVFFTAAARCEESGYVGSNYETFVGEGPAVDELYARIDGERTVAVSEPAASDCQACNVSSEPRSALFQGASQNGERVVFMTEQELLPGQQGMNLYEYDFGGPERKKISLVSSGSSNPEVQGVMRVSEDGSHIYFVARGVLAANAGAGGHPAVAGADNLYVYEPDAASPDESRPVFVATLMSPEEASTIANEVFARFAETLQQCNFTCFPEAVSALMKELESIEAGWQSTDVREAQATPEGRFVIFKSWARLTEDDTSKVPQLFEYDAQSRVLRRVSIGNDGHNNNGNMSIFADAPLIAAPNYHEVDSPATASSMATLSDDGSSVFFESADALAPEATSGRSNVYEYRGGNVYLISDGTDLSEMVSGHRGAELLGTSESGADVFFWTGDALVPEDGNTQFDLYDARIDGGFGVSVEAAACFYAGCRSVGTRAYEHPPESSAVPPEGNAPGPGTARRRPRVTARQKLIDALRACRKRPARQRARCVRRARRQHGARARRSTMGGRPGAGVAGRRSGKR